MIKMLSIIPTASLQLSVYFGLIRSFISVRLEDLLICFTEQCPVDMSETVVFVMFSAGLIRSVLT